MHFRRRDNPSINQRSAPMKPMSKKPSADYLSLLEKAKKDYEEYLKITGTLEVLTVTEEDVETRNPSLDRPLTKNAF